MNVGVNAGTNPQSGNVFARVGIRKDVGVIVPKIEPADSSSDDLDSNGQPIAKAASSYVASRVTVVSPWKAPKVAEVIATGQSAINLGEKDDALKPFTAPNTTTP